MPLSQWATTDQERQLVALADAIQLPQYRDIMPDRIILPPRTTVRVTVRPAAVLHYPHRPAAVAAAWRRMLAHVPDGRSTWELPHA
jgi:hypothetical protein